MKIFKVPPGIFDTVLHPGSGRRIVDLVPTDCEHCAAEGLTRDADGTSEAGAYLCHEHLSEES